MHTTPEQRLSQRTAASRTPPGAWRNTRLNAAAADQKVDQFQTGPASSDFMQERMDFLKADMKHLFDDQGVDKSQYDEKVDFRDPITKYGSISGYLFNISMLKVVFAPIFELHDLRQTAEHEITTRWTMTMKFTLNKYSPIKKWWSPVLVFTGISIMGINPKNGKVNKHLDAWDAIKNQEFFSFEGFKHVLSQMLTTQKIPDLDGPKFQIMKKMKTYEIRRYDPFTVAETDMGSAPTGQESGSGPKGSKEGETAFGRLAGYIFGKNSRQEKMSMTAPVFSHPSGRLQFVMDKAHQEISQLPKPETDAVELKNMPGGFFAAKIFSGAAKPDVVKQQEASLRQSLRQDGVPIDTDEYLLARYNDPSTMAVQRRNEVLIPINDFSLW
ncbi:hypothetical protein WJX74_007465 [Apatococcus lobatus]|uniref:SOUL heme-binding protein n=2 Tax=Apatococcus TaxID=904362 RepID=A0AAW1T0Y2_9CHLO